MFVLGIGLSCLGMGVGLKHDEGDGFLLATRGSREAVVGVRHSLLAVKKNRGATNRCGATLSKLEDSSTGKNCSIELLQRSERITFTGSPAGEGEARGIVCRYQAAEESSMPRSS